MIVPLPRLRKWERKARVVSNQPNDVGVELSDNVLPRKGFDRTKGAIARVVHEHIDIAKFLDRATCCFCNGFGVRHVKAEKRYAFQFLQVCALACIAHGGSDFPALFAEVLDGGFADAAGAACDQDGFCHFESIPSRCL